MLDDDDTLDWEKWLPAMMLSYNTQVHRATMESPFFLTYLHDPRLPYFDMDRPKPMYKDNFNTEAITRLGFSYRLAKENMEEATKLREAYVNKKSKERQFAVGDRCLVHFPNVKPGQNQKFTSRWRGIYTVVAIVGPVNVKLRLTPTPPTSPKRPPRDTARRAPRKPRARRDPAKPKNQRARKHLVVYIDSSSSMPDSSEEDNAPDQVPAPGSPQPGPAPTHQHQTPTRYIAGGDEQT